MSKPTKKELQGILEAHQEYYGGDQLTLNHLNHVVIIRNYVPDCPGWCGHIALVVHGDACYKDIFYYDFEKERWSLAESMNEGDYSINPETYNS
jgi:hypothetical protein